MTQLESKLLRALDGLLKLPQNQDSTDPKIWNVIHRAQRLAGQVRRGPQT
jgi:hypothetical protein